LIGPQNPYESVSETLISDERMVQNILPHVRESTCRSKVAKHIVCEEHRELFGRDKRSLNEEIVK
jgi:hypothetical protein